MARQDSFITDCNNIPKWAHNSLNVKTLFNGSIPAAIVPFVEKRRQEIFKYKSF